jgi:hypothetical protein
MLEWSLWLVSFHNNKKKNKNIISSLSRSSNEKYIKFMASLFRVPIVTYQSNRHICMLRTTTVNSTFVPYKYHKKPCISCRNLLLKGFWGWGGVQITYYERFWETFQDVGCDGTDIWEDIDLEV